MSFNRMFLISSKLPTRLTWFVKKGASIADNPQWLRQLFSTRGKHPESELKSCLRALYKRCHPDLFANLPLEHKENTRSLKLLHDYLAQSRGSYSGPSAVFRFVFYVKSEETANNSRRVAITLPPPVTVPDSFPLPTSTKNALHRLLTAVGVSEELTRALQGSDQEESLRSFLITAAEHVRWNEATDSSAIKRLHHAKLIIHMTKQITVRLGAQCEEKSTLEQSESVEKLAWALDHCQEKDFSDQMMMIGGDGIDSGGRLWLPCEASPQEWLRILLEVDTNEMTLRRVALTRIKSKEKEVAIKMGIGMIYSSAEIRVQSVYSRFLDDLNFMAESIGSVGTGMFVNLPLCVVCQESDHCEISTDPELGFIRVPLDADPSKIFRYIEDHGESALKVLSRYQASEKDLQELVESVRKRLRLRRLECDVNVSRQEYREACNRLMSNVDQFGDWIEGLCIRISNANRLIKNSTLVEVKWDFGI